MKSQTINVNYLNFSFHENQRPYDTRPKKLTKVYNRITNPEFQHVSQTNWIHQVYNDNRGGKNGISEMVDSEDKKRTSMAFILLGEFITNKK